MKTDVIHVSSSGKGMNEALAQAEAAANYKSLSKKDAIRMRLLAEELLGMFRSIAGKTEADFWVEDENKSFELHLISDTQMTNSSPCRQRAKTPPQRALWAS